ncbi:MAG: TrbG/VirB9 family P-type conjugative transfer protein [Sphingomicrobium sp.]
MTHLHSLATALTVATLAFPSAAQGDPRFSDRAYAANQIITVHGKPGIESAIAFSPDERIENIAVGNSSAWQVNPNKRANVVFVKPATARARTNMTVITDQRTYLFDLVSSAGGSPVYMLQFRYPDAPKRAPIAAPPSAATAVAVVTQPREPAIPATLNFGWRGAGEKKLLPASYFDDGSSTFLRWTQDTPLPAILIRNPEGAEGPVNYTVRGDYVVVEGIPAQLVLRSGKQVATLTPLRRLAPAPTVTASATPLQLQTAAGNSEQ